jgi:polysaccharide export outer membrane protein
VVAGISTNIMNHASTAPVSRHPARRAPLTLSLALLLAFSGCQHPSAPPPATAAPAPANQVLRAGDVIRVAFPRSPALDLTQQIRRDGKINLYLVGEVVAAGLAPAELEARLVAGYANEVVSHEVRVTVVSSAFAVFVTGAVLRPGKINAERTLTAFDAIMEAGGFDLTRADTRSVRIIRQEEGRALTYTFDAKAVLDGRAGAPFHLQPFDTIFVPERFTWF